MTTQDAFTFNFTHRVNAELDASPYRLHDCMNPALERAAAIADVLESALESTRLYHLWRAVEAIRLEVLDAQAMLNAYVEGSRKSGFK